MLSSDRRKKFCKVFQPTLVDVTRYFCKKVINKYINVSLVSDGCRHNFIYSSVGMTNQNRGLFTVQLFYCRLLDGCGFSVYGCIINLLLELKCHSTNMTHVFNDIQHKILGHGNTIFSCLRQYVQRISFS